MLRSQFFNHVFIHCTLNGVWVLVNASLFSWRTCLPLARTRWVWSTFSSHSPLSSHQRHWLTFAASTLFPLQKIWVCWELNLGQLGEKHVCYLCAMLPSKNVSLFDWHSLINENSSSTKCCLNVFLSPNHAKLLECMLSQDSRPITSVSLLGIFLINQTFCVSSIEPSS